MTKKERQINRIQQMEAILDETQEAEKALENALNRFEALARPVAKLSDYYSGLWREDFEADEAGLLPASLKRGVLSEDALWDALTAYRGLVIRMADVIKNNLSKGPL